MNFEARHPRVATVRLGGTEQRNGHLEASPVVRTGPPAEAPARDDAEQPKRATQEYADALARVPRVSIGLPVYNGERYLREAIDSILAQTFTDFELIISDNASTDGTAAICLEYAARDRRIAYYRQPRNRGGAWNFNHVFRLSAGEYFKWASHDDVLAPTFLERCIEPLDRNASVVVCYPGTIKINEHGKEVFKYKIRLRTDSPAPSRRFHELLRIPHSWYQGSGLIRAEALRKTPLIGPYSESDRILLTWLGLLGQFHEVPEYLFRSRAHAGQSVRVSRYDRTTWFDPSHQGTIVLPVWRLFFEHFVCIREVPLRASDRARCYLSALRWPFWNGNGVWMAMDLVHAARIASRMLRGRWRATKGSG
ncbi:MAG: glycosyl transferase family 2 [Chloroflexi bacterium]|nr:glycosyl transferase family 2 [Chloroflexota bacterium]